MLVKLFWQPRLTTLKKSRCTFLAFLSKTWLSSEIPSFFSTLLKRDTFCVYCLTDTFRWENKDDTVSTRSSFNTILKIIFESAFTNSSDVAEKNRSNHRRCSVRKGVLRNFAKFTGKHLCHSLLKKKKNILDHNYLSAAIVYFCIYIMYFM